jgi:site-specific DNA-adenine methylase
VGKFGRGVNRQIPYLTNAGTGVNRQIPHLGCAGRDKRHLENLSEYFQVFADRLRFVRIANGDWSRVLNAGVTAFSDSGIFLDPPYPGDTYKTMYAGGTSDDPALNSRQWAIENGEKCKIIYAGYFPTHDEFFPDDWQRVRWKAGRGYSNTENSKADQETLWASPLCNKVDKFGPMGSLFDEK